MRTLLIVATIICFTTACRNEYSGLNPGGEIFSIKVLLDDENIEKNYSPHQPNEFSAYSFGGVAGNYFGYISSFKINSKEKIDVRFGTLLSQHNVLTREETLVLVAPGKKNFGSLGSFSSYPQLKPNCAEVAFVDRNSVRWCSTAITERATSYGIDAAVEIKQPEGEFVIDQVKEALIADTTKGFRVSGHFSCLVYDVNGNHSKKMKGNFSGLISNGD